MNFVRRYLLLPISVAERTMCRKSHMRCPAPIDDFRNQIAQALLATSQPVELVEEKIFMERTWPRRQTPRNRRA